LRANRLFLPGYVWHITHRCHKKDYLLKFVQDRENWVHWLFEAKKRFGIKVLNYNVTCNHIHLLLASGKNESSISSAMQLIAGRVAQEFNERKNRRGAFWEDRYHATAVESGRHLVNCMIYIDMNMVRAGVAEHPMQWKTSGYNELKNSKTRYKRIDEATMVEYCGFSDISEFREVYFREIDRLIAARNFGQKIDWSGLLAIGSSGFVEKFRREAGIIARYRDVEAQNEEFMLKEEAFPYSGKNDPQIAILREKNAVFWEEN